MKLRLCITYIGNFIDLISTIYLTRLGFYEVNPFMRPLLAYPWLFSLVKLSAMTWVCWFLWKNRNDKHALPLATFSSVFYGAIAIYYIVWFFILYN